MTDWEVEMHGNVREVYLVKADTEEEARLAWFTGDLIVSEASEMEFYRARRSDD